MKRILIPAMGKSMFFSDSYFPKPMIEIDGKTVLEHVIEDYNTIDDKRFIFVFSEEDCRKFHLDDSAKILTEGNADILMLKNQTEGALCTCLMAIEYLGMDEPLIIANSDQVISHSYFEVLKSFEEKDVDAGVIVFDSVHPRWSYVKLVNDEVVETAEKRPLSKHAIAGFYYFKKGRDYVDAAKRVILKDNRVDDHFYISSSINEMVLMGKRIGSYEISKKEYHSFYSPEKIREYESGIREGL